MGIAPASPFVIRHSSFVISRVARPGFTLVELLVVIAIIVVLTALVLPAFNSISSGNRIANAAQLVTGQLDLARQTALSENRQIEVRFYMLAESGGAPAWRAMRMMSGEGVPLDKLQWLPTGVVFAPETSFSTILSADNTNGGTETVPGKGDVTYKAVRFAPDGSTSLPSAGAGTAKDEWFLSLKSANDPVANGKPAANFAAIMIDPVTGRLRTFRP